MQHKIDVIWTDNVSDFKHFRDSIEIENPLIEDWKTVVIDSSNEENGSH